MLHGTSYLVLSEGFLLDLKVLPHALQYFFLFLYIHITSHWPSKKINLAFPLEFKNKYNLSIGNLLSML